MLRTSESDGPPTLIGSMELASSSSIRPGGAGDVVIFAHERVADALRACLSVGSEVDIVEGPKAVGRLHVREVAPWTGPGRRTHE